MLLEPSTSKNADYFYTCLETDAKAYEAMKKCYLDRAGKITPLFEKIVTAQKYKLDTESVSRINSNIASPFIHDGRCEKIPLNLTTSFKTLLLAMHNAASVKFDKQIKIYQIGKSIFYDGQSNFRSIFNKWDMEAYITEYFLEKIKATPNDYDYRIEIEPHLSEELINHGLVKPLADAFDWKNYGLSQLIDEIEGARKFAKEHLPEHAYLSRLFKFHSHLLLNQANIPEVFIKTFGFDTAKDIVGDTTKNQFHLRSINKYDIVIPISTKQQPFQTSSIIEESLSIDITDLVLKGSEDIYLKSSFGKKLTPQAIWDANLGNMTLSGTPNEFHFMRLISHLTNHGRSYAKDNISQTFSELEKAVSQSDRALPIVLAKQIYHRSKKLPWPITSLFPLTFNTCALLSWLDSNLDKEIPKIWQWVLSYVDENYVTLINEPEVTLFKVLYDLLKNSSITWKDINTQFIATVLIIQQGSSLRKSSYICQPTQTEGQLFNQIEIIFPDKNYKSLELSKSKDSNQSDESKIEFNKTPSCTLLFPNKITEALAHLGKLADFQPHTLTEIKQIHDLLLKENPMDVKMGSSRLNSYRLDPQRQFSQVTQGASHLLTKKHEHAWRMGYFLLISQLAMHEDPPVFTLMLKGVLDMLLCTWASEDFKVEVVNNLHNFLENSGIEIKDSSFRKHKLLDQMHDVLSLKDKKFQGFAFEYLESIEEKFSSEDFSKLYFTLGKTYASTFSQDLSSAKVLQTLLKYMLQSKELTLETKVKLISSLYSRKEIRNDTRTEEFLFCALLQTFQCMNSLSKIIDSNVKNCLPKLAELAIHCQNRELDNFQSLCFGYEIYRLNIFQNEDNIIRDRCLNRFKVLCPNTELSSSPNPFDFLSNAIQSYHLHDSESLVTSIRHRLKEYDKHKISSKKKFELITLIKVLAQSNISWENRNILFEFIEKTSNLCLLNEIEIILDQFHTSQSNTDINELLVFYMSFLQKNSSWLCYWMLKTCLTMMGNKQNTQLNNGLFKELTKHLIKTNSLGILPKHAKKLTNNYLICLAQCKKWNEIIDIFTSSPRVPFDWTSESGSVLITAIAQLKNPQHKDIICQLLEELPLDIELARDAKATFILLYPDLFNQCMNSQEFLKAFSLTQIRQKLCGLKKGFESQDFELLTQLTLKHHSIEAHYIMQSLFERVSGLNEWLKIFRICLNMGQLSVCIQIFEKCTIFSDNEDAKQTYEDLINEFHRKIHDLSIANKQINNNFINTLFNFSLQLLSKTNLNSSAWLTYIEKAVLTAPLSTVENTFDTLIEIGESKIPNGKERIHSWMLILECFEKNQSKRLLYPDLWWAKVWKDLQHTSIADQFHLIKSLIQNGNKESLSDSSNKVKFINKKTSDEIINSAKSILMIVESINMNDFTFDDETILNISKLYWYANNIEKAFFFLETVIMNEYKNSICAEHAIQMFNEYLTLIKDKTHHDENLCLHLISAALEYFAPVNHFTILEYIKTVHPNQLHCKAGYDDTYLYCVRAALYEILVQPVNEKHKSHTEHKKLFWWAMQQLYLPSKLYGWEVVDRCLSKESTYKYLNDEQLALIKTFKSDSKIRATDFINIKTEHLLFDHRAFKTFFRDTTIEQEKGFDFKVSFMKDLAQYLKIQGAMSFAMVAILAMDRWIKYG